MNIERLLKIFYIIAFTVIFVGVVIGVTFIFWLTYPYKTIEFNTEVAKVRNKQVERGEYLYYEIDYCKYTSKEAKLTRSFIDGVKYDIPDGYSDVEKGCAVKVIQIYIPKGIGTGTYMIKQVRHYQVNPIRAIDVAHFTEQFEVI